MKRPTSETRSLRRYPTGSGLIRHQFPGVQLLDVLRQHQHRQTGDLLADVDGGSQPLIGEAGRQPDVDHRDVRPVRGRLPGLDQQPAGRLRNAREMSPFAGRDPTSVDLQFGHEV
jgi:hypothetical protein